MNHLDQVLSETNRQIFQKFNRLSPILVVLRSQAGAIFGHAWVGPMSNHFANVHFELMQKLYAMHATNHAMGYMFNSAPISHHIDARYWHNAKN
jgi:hypothetical protein